MENTRETKEFKTSSGKNTLVLYTYATGREMRAIDSKYVSSMKLDLKNGEPSMNNIDMSVAYEAENEMIKALVVSINGSTEGVIDAILDLHQDEYNEIIAELNVVTKKKTK